MVEDPVHRTLLDDAAVLHDEDAVAELVDDVEVVGDKEVAQVELLPELLQELQDLGLDGDVQRGDGLVRDEEAGAPDQRGGDADALALAAGELGGHGGENLLRQLHPCKHVAHAAFPLGAVVLAEDAEGFFEGPLHVVGGVQGAVGVLEDDLGTFGVVDDLPFLRLQEAEDEAGEGGLPGAAVRRKRYADPVHIKTGGMKDKSIMKG